MKDKYKYHVTYAFHDKTGRGTGVGSRVIATKKKITCTSDLVDVKNRIAAEICKHPVILNFVLLDTKWGFWEWAYTIAELTLLALCVLTLIASIFG